MVHLMRVLVVLSTWRFASTEIHVGWSASLSGRLHVAGKSIHDGYMFWVNSVNNANPPGILVGGVRHSLKVTFYDDKSDYETSKTLYEKLISEDKIDFLLGPYSSGINVHIAPIAHKHKRLMIISAASSRTVYNATIHAYSFGVPSTAAAYTTSALDSLSSSPFPGAKTLFVTTENELFSLLAAEGAINHWKNQLNLTVVAPLQTFSTCEGASSVSKIVANMSAYNPDVIVVSGHYEESLLFARDIFRSTTSSYRPRGMIFTSSGLTQLLRDLPDANLNSVISPAEWHSSLSYNGIKWSSPQAYNEAFLKYLNDPATGAVSETKTSTNQWHAEATAAGIVLQHAVETSGTLDTETVITVLKSMNIITFFGPVKFNSDGQNSGKPMAAVQLQDGNEVLVSPSGPQTPQIRYPIKFGSACIEGVHPGDSFVQDPALVKTISLGGYATTIVLDSLLILEVTVVIVMAIRSGMKRKHRVKSEILEARGQDGQWSNVSQEPSLQGNKLVNLKRVSGSILSLDWMRVKKGRPENRSSNNSSSIRTSSSLDSPCIDVEGSSYAIRPTINNYIQLLTLPAEALQLLSILLIPTDSEDRSDEKILPWMSDSKVLSRITVVDFDFEWYFWIISFIILVWVVYFIIVVSGFAESFMVEKYPVLRVLLMPSEYILILVPSLGFIPGVRVLLKSIQCSVWLPYAYRVLGLEVGVKSGSPEDIVLVLGSNCELHCWQGLHWAIAIVGILLLLAFFPCAIVCIPFSQSMQLAEGNLDILYSYSYFSIWLSLKLALVWLAVFVQVKQPYVFYCVANCILVFMFLTFITGKACSIPWVSYFQALLFGLLSFVSIICTISLDHSNQDSIWPQLVLGFGVGIVLVSYFLWDKRNYQQKFLNPGLGKRSQITAYLQRCMK